MIMIDTATQPDALLRWMSTLADATRIRLLRMLERQELGVSDLCDIVQMPQSTVSRHLKLLGDEGWTTSHRQGTTNLYRMMLDELEPTQRNLWLLAREQTEDWATLKQDQLRLARRLRDRRGDSKQFFAGAAAEWDRMRIELYGPNVTREAMLSLLPANWVVADLGCGTGTLTEQLSRQVKQVIGIDNSEEMLAAAEQTIHDRQNVVLKQGDLEAIPIEDQMCDAAILMLVLTYLPEPAVVLGEMNRILRPGGRGVVIDLLQHDRDEFRRQMGQQCMGFTSMQLKGLLEEAGFAKARCGQIPPESATKGPALLSATGVKP